MENLFTEISFTIAFILISSGVSVILGGFAVVIIHLGLVYGGFFSENFTLYFLGGISVGVLTFISTIQSFLAGEGRYFTTVQFIIERMV